MNKVWTRIFLIAAAAAFILFISNDFGLIDIRETAIVVALGIDMPNEGDGLDVTAQIAVPASAGSGPAGNVTVKNARSVGDAVAMMNRETGWYPTLVHCRLVLVGEALTERDLFDALDYFLRNDSVEDSCLVAVCSGRAEQIMAARSPVGDISAEAVLKVLSAEAQKTGQVSVNTLRTFAIGYYSVTESGYLPYLSVKREAESQGGGAQAGGAKQASGRAPSIGRNRRWRLRPQPIPRAASAEGGEGKAGESGSADVFDAARTMLFYRGRRAALLTQEETLAFNLACARTDFAYGNVYAEKDGQERAYNLQMKIGKKKRTLRFTGETPVFTFRIRAKARIVDADRADGILAIAKTQIADAAVLRAAEEKFRSELMSAYRKAAEAGCDLFGLKLKLYRFCHKQYEAHKDTALTEAALRFDIRFSSVK